LRFFLRFRLIAALLFFAALGLTYLIFQRVAQGLCAQRRPGIFHNRGAERRPGPRLNTPRGIGQQVQHILQDIPKCAAFSRSRASASAASASNQL
jgi:hypothetical protein